MDREAPGASKETGGGSPGVRLGGGAAWGGGILGKGHPVCGGRGWTSGRAESRLSWGLAIASGSRLPRAGRELWGLPGVMQPCLVATSPAVTRAGPELQIPLTGPKTAPSPGSVPTSRGSVPSGTFPRFLPRGHACLLCCLLTFPTTNTCPRSPFSY